MLLDELLHREDIPEDAKGVIRQICDDRITTTESLQQFIDIFINIRLPLHILHLEDISNDRTLKIIAANPAAAELTKVPLEEMIGKNLDEKFPRLREKGIPQKCAEVVRSGKSIELEDFYCGNECFIKGWFRFKVFPLPNNCVGAAYENTTEHKRAETALSESERKFKDFADLLPQVIFETDEKGDLTFINSEAFSIFARLKNGSYKGLNLLEIIAPEDRDRAKEHINQLLCGERLGGLEYRAIRKDGSPFPISLYSCPVLHEDRPRGMRGIILDLTDQKRKESELEKRKGQLRAFYELDKKLTSVVSKEELLPWIAEKAAEFFDANECFFRIREGDYLVRGGGTRGGEELMVKERLRMGEDLCGLIARTKRPIAIFDNLSKDPRLIPEQREIADRYGLKSLLGVPMCIEWRVIGVLMVMTKKPTEFTDSDTELLRSFADHAALAFENFRLFGDLEGARKELEGLGKELEREVEERTRELEEIHLHLIRSERLAAMGRLAGSIAHEINNPLQAIDSFISSVIKKADKQNQDTLKLAQEGINRIASIVKQLLAFHHPETEKKKLADINPIIEKTLSLTRNQLSLNKIRIKKELSPGLPKVRVSSQQIHQVLLNLILNAQDAMPHGGELKVRTERDKENISIEVSDTGVGIPEKHLGRIFEPFFTADKEKGTGLGLSISYGIIKAHGGDIQVKSKERQGTAFTIRLPIRE